MNPPDDPMPASPVLELRSIVVDRGQRRILDHVDLLVAGDENWLVLGANGSGKTTLLRIASMYDHPTSGTVRVLGEELGRTDVRHLRRRVGYASAALAAEFRPELPAVDVVMTAKHAALEPWWHHYDDADRHRALACLERMSVESFADRPLATLSSGEQQRVLLARTLMNDPGVVLLDEPSARLDLGGRAHLVHALDDLAAAADGPPIVLVTHHVDEVPDAVTHVLMLRDGAVISSGTLDVAFTSEALSECFGTPLELDRRPDGRWTAWARRR